MSLTVRVLTLTGVQFELTMQQPAPSSSSSSLCLPGAPAGSSSLPSPAPVRALLVSDVKRVLPFPFCCTTLVHCGAAASDDAALSSLRVSEPFVVILDKAKWRRSLASATAAASKRLHAFQQYDSADEQSEEAEEAEQRLAGYRYHASKRLRRSAGSGGGVEAVLDEVRRYDTDEQQQQHQQQRQQAMRLRRERRYQPTQTTTAAGTAAAAVAGQEGKEREGKESEERVLQESGHSGQMRRYRARLQPRQPPQQQPYEGGGDGGATGAEDNVADVASSGSSSGGPYRHRWSVGESAPQSGLSSVSSRLRSSIARVEQLRDARERLLQLQQRSRQQQQPHRAASSRESLSGSLGRVELQQLEGMGFPSHSAEQALKRCGGNLSDAIELLMTHNDTHFVD